MYAAQRRNLTLAATGDSLITQRLPAVREPGFAALIDRIAAADVAFTNLETVIRVDEGWPQYEIGGATWVWSSPEVLRDLQSMGFDLFSTAQNHMLDWGQDGVAACLEYLRDAGAVHAGAGMTLAEARRPAYLESPQGRVALVAATTTFFDWNRAGASRGDCAGRPGINPLRIRPTIEVNPEAFAVLEGVAERLHLGSIPPRVRSRAHPKHEGEIVVMEQHIRRADRDAVVYELDAADEAAILAAIAEARRQADWVFVSLHAHEMEGEVPQSVPDYLRAFAHRSVDAGADGVIAHGAHVLRGVEIYRGRPILHGLGNFFFQNETLEYQPAEFYERSGVGPDASPGEGFDARTDRGKRGFPAGELFWESALATCEWEDGRLIGLRVHPVTLGFGLARSIRGRPVLAAGDAGKAIVSNLDRLSEPYGVRFVWDEAGACGIARWAPA